MFTMFTPSQIQWRKSDLLENDNIHLEFCILIQESENKLNGLENTISIVPQDQLQTQFLKEFTKT